MKNYYLYFIYLTYSFIEKNELFIVKFANIKHRSYKLCLFWLQRFYLKSFVILAEESTPMLLKGKKKPKASQWRHEPAPWKLALEENLIQFNSNAAAIAAKPSIRSRDRGREAIARHLRPFRMMRVFSLREDWRWIVTFQKKLDSEKLGDVYG